MDPTTVHARRAELRILDVREDDEWAQGRIAGSTHIPMAEVPARLAELDAAREWVVVCHLGQRSAAVTDYLGRLGFAAANLDGGLARWAAAGLPLEYGRV